MKAAAIQRDITPPVGIDITHPARPSVGVHDPLYMQALLLEDGGGNRVLIARFDLMGIDFDLADELQETFQREHGITRTLLNFSHPHSSRYFTARSDEPSAEAEWINGAHDKLAEAVVSACASLESVSLYAGRAPAQVGFNRRVLNEEGRAVMAVNRDAPRVPWVNTLEVRRPDGRPLAVLFEHPAHPVIVPDQSRLISADFPGAASARVRERLGGDVVALFGQGCCGNINAFPLRTSHENAEKAGRELGDAVIDAMAAAVPVGADRLDVRVAARVELPTRELPAMDVWEEASESLDAARSKGADRWITAEEYRVFRRRLDTIREMMERGEERGLPRRLDVTAVMLGREWLLVAMPHELFCEYELWIDEAAPFAHTMTLGYTNGGQGYIAVDKDLAMGPKGGYEAGCLPRWGAFGSLSEHLGPPAVGVEGIVKNTIAGLWKPRQS